MSRRHAGAASQADTTVGPPTVPQTTLPSEQLSTIQKRLAQLTRSLTELEAEIATEQGLADWPSLLSRHTSLLSHVHSLTTSITTPSSHFLASQLNTLEEALLTEAQASNDYIESGGPAVGSTEDALFAGTVERDAHDERIDGHDVQALPQVTYIDRRNRLARLAAHPVSKVAEAEKAAALGSVLRTRLEPEVTIEEQHNVESYENWLKFRRSDTTLSLEETADERAARQLEEVRDDATVHDSLVLRALRTWHHLSAAPDEAGETYNWRMRLDADLTGQTTDDAARTDAMDVDGMQLIGKRKLADEATAMAWSTKDAIKLLYAA